MLVGVACPPLLQANGKQQLARQVLGRMLHRQLGEAWATWREVAWEEPRQRAAQELRRAMLLALAYKAWGAVTRRSRQLKGAHLQPCPLRPTHLPCGFPAACTALHCTARHAKPRALHPPP
jgi:hypothetical protein